MNKEQGGRAALPYKSSVTPLHFVERWNQRRRQQREIFGVFGGAEFLISIFEPCSSG